MYYTDDVKLYAYGDRYGYFDEPISRQIQFVTSEPYFNDSN